MQIKPEILSLLRCPLSGEPLRHNGDELVSQSGRQHYPIDSGGVPHLIPAEMSSASQTQHEHYQKIDELYARNLTYPHTQLYLDYLQQLMVSQFPRQELGVTAELCCGSGECLGQLAERYALGIGVDLNESALRLARASQPAQETLFVQGDVTRLPLAENAFDTVVMRGGIHHVPDRPGLFAKIRRILKPGGLFVWLEPVDDCWLWRLLRIMIYRLSPVLEQDTEHPLRRSETESDLAAAGLRLENWKTCAFLGYCVLMNSDVLVFNRVFRFIPGIRTLSRMLIGLDQLTALLPGLTESGAQVVGMARKPD